MHSIARRFPIHSPITHGTNSVNSELISQGKFLRLVRRGRWEIAERVLANGVVVVVPQLSDGRWLLIEQYREAVSSSCVEFPAGLSGDSADDADELLTVAAMRELEEETGYAAKQIFLLGRAAPSPGLTSETMTFFGACDLTQVSDGGGVGNERIIVHLIHDTQIDRWLENKAGEAIVSAMVYAGLYLARSRPPKTTSTTNS